MQNGRVESVGGGEDEGGEFFRDGFKALPRLDFLFVREEVQRSRHVVDDRGQLVRQGGSRFFLLCGRRRLLFAGRSVPGRSAALSKQQA